jgi:single-stranded-DNA-specific exonuclease
MTLDTVDKFSKIFLEKVKGRNIHLVSHFDTDGISSAAIASKTFERLDIQFSVKILKSLSDEEIDLFPDDKLIVILDLGSGSLKKLAESKKEIFIIDHHEINGENISEDIDVLNFHLIEGGESLCSAELTYLFARAISIDNKDLAHLAILGMIGDVMEKTINKTRDMIIKEANVRIKKGLLIYPSTRPLDRALEYNSRPFIPGVTGDSQGTFELLREAGIEREGNRFKALIDLTEEEMRNLVTSVMLRLNGKEKDSDFIGNLYLLKFFNKIEDARELSAIINACSRMDKPEIALMLCLGNVSARKMAERIYVKYRQHIISGLRYIDQNKKIEGREYIIINAKDQIKDTIIGTLASILSFSSMYKEGTIIIAMAYNEDKIKVSTRMAGRNVESGRNLKELLDSVMETLGGQCGGHKMAAGCVISRDDEEKFIGLMKKKLEFEVERI